MLDILANVLSDSNQTIEHGFALECIWNLCFDEKVRLFIRVFLNWFKLFNRLILRQKKW